MKRPGRSDAEIRMPDGQGPVWRRLEGALRFAIEVGRLRPGARLPASRVLAGQLAVSRNTVLAAYDELSSQGYIRARIGDGSYVVARENRMQPPFYLRPGRVVRDPDGMPICVWC